MNPGMAAKVNPIPMPGDARGHEGLPELTVLEGEEEGRDGEEQRPEGDHAPGAEVPLVDRQATTGQEGTDRERDEDQARDHDRGAEPVAVGGRYLDELDDDRQEAGTWRRRSGSPRRRR